MRLSASSPGYSYHNQFKASRNTLKSNVSFGCIPQQTCDELGAVRLRLPDPKDDNNRYLRLYKVVTGGDTERPITWYMADRPLSNGGVCVLTLIEDADGEWRAAFFLKRRVAALGKIVLENVAGNIEPRQSAKDSAAAELQEELGYTIPANNFNFLQKVFPSAGMSTEQTYLYYVAVPNDVKQGKPEFYKDPGEMHTFVDIVYPKLSEIRTPEKLQAYVKSLEKKYGNEVIIGESIPAMLNLIPAKVLDNPLNKNWLSLKWNVIKQLFKRLFGISSNKSDQFVQAANLSQDSFAKAA